MDEATWNSCGLLYELLAEVREQMSDRQRRLFAVGCCSRALRLIHDSRSLRALDVALRFADGRADLRELQIAQIDASEAYIDLRDSRFKDVAWSRQSELLAQAAALTVAIGVYYAEDAADCVRWGLLAADGWRVEQEAESAQCDLLREIVGPVFAEVRIEPVWLCASDGAVSQLADYIDREQAFDDMPYLADALEDAGCVDERILAHCRHQTKHVRGCWVLDRVLRR